MRHRIDHSITTISLTAFLLATLAGGAIFPVMVLAQTDLPAQDVTAVWHTAPSDLAVGDIAELTLAVMHPADLQALLPALGDRWDDFEVRSQSPVVVVEHADGSLTTRQTIEVILFAPGDYTTPPLTVTLSDAAGNLREISVEPAMVTVASVLTDGETELRDIKGQALMPPARNMLPLVGGLMILAGLAGAGWRLYRRSRQVVDTRTSLERAMDDLEGIARADYLATDQVARHYVEATGVLRRYLEEAHGFPARELTTTELKVRLEQSEIAPVYVDEMIGLLNDADLVKFANLTVKDEAAARLIADLRTLMHGLAAHTTAPASVAPDGDKSAERQSQPVLHGA
jgi:hypothetical protein